MTWTTDWMVSCDDCGWTPTLNSFSSEATAEEVATRHAKTAGHALTVEPFETQGADWDDHYDDSDLAYEGGWYA